jgi:hypothetical protein
MAKTGKKWDDELCAEHDGTIASFDKLGVQLEDIANFEFLFQGEAFNILRAAKIGAGVVGGVAVIAPLAVLAAPAVAASLGTTGILGAASTGTAISTLSGAALTNASLAAIGGGSMASGVLVFTAAGAALGGIRGGSISNSYFGEIDHFHIRKLKSSNKEEKHAVIVINGFMSQGVHDTSDWIAHLPEHFPNSAWYHTDWESKNLHKLGSYLVQGTKNAMKAGGLLGRKAAKNAAKKIGPLAFVDLLADLFDNPWHTCMVKASMTGILLADAIARTPGWRFTLVGHSLGARVIYYALESLSTKSTSVIDDVYLLGGAVGGGIKDKDGWSDAASTVTGKIYNCFSKQDDVLKYMYQGANGFMSSPIGYAPIETDHPKILNLNCTAEVDGHMSWKQNFGNILTKLSKM